MNYNIVMTNIINHSKDMRHVVDGFVGSSDEICISFLLQKRKKGFWGSRWEDVAYNCFRLTGNASHLPVVTITCDHSCLPFYRGAFEVNNVASGILSQYLKMIARRKEAQDELEVVMSASKNNIL